MKIHASVLAADVFSTEHWLQEKVAQNIDAFHVDIIDPSFANFIGVDFRIIEKIATMQAFYIHYMATWNTAFIEEILKLRPETIFFHQDKIGNMEYFHNISAGIALRLGEQPIIDVAEYVLMNVPLGYCGQTFNDASIQISHELKQRGKTTISDGGINLGNIHLLKHFDAAVIGAGLNQHTVEEFREQTSKL